MSLSNPVERSTNNPVVRYYTFNGATGTLSYYDKETEQKVEVTEPFIFIPTDERNAVEGFDSKKEMGFRSNEVISTAKEELVIRWNSGQVLMQGLYSDIKDKVKAQGGKYIKSIYGITKIDGEWKMINLRLKGAAFSAWLEFDSQKRGGVLGLTIAITKGAQKKTGMVNYFEPKFIAKVTSEDLHKLAVEADGELQEYFKNRNTPLGATKLDELMSDITEEEKSQLRAPGAAKTKAKSESTEVVDASEDDFFSDL
jgi:hypothetical protein